MGHHVLKTQEHQSEMEAQNQRKSSCQLKYYCPGKNESIKTYKPVVKEGIRGTSECTHLWELRRSIYGCLSLG